MALSRGLKTIAKLRLTMPPDRGPNIAILTDPEPMNSR
jgi:hypothetical protein